jgi:PAS domain S-box-containing protein
MVPSSTKRVNPKKEEDRKILDQVIHSIGIAEAMQEPLWLGDKNHRTIYVNPVYEKISGYSLKECIGQSSDFCFDEKSKRIIAEHHKKRKKGSSSQYEATILSKTGKKTPVLVSGAPTSTGGTIGIFIDLTQQKKLAADKKLAEQIVKNSNEAIVVLDKNRRVRLWNTGAEKLFGYKEEKIIKKKIDMLIPTEKEVENHTLLKEVEDRHYIKNYETKRKTKNGELVDVSLSISKVTDTSRKFIGFLVIYRDITDRKKISNELQKRFEAIQDAYKELGLQKRQNDYLFEITQLATTKNSIKNVAHLIISAVTMITKCDAATLRILDKGKDNAKLIAHLGVDSRWLSKANMKVKGGLQEEAFSKKRPIIIHDLAGEARYKGIMLAKEHGFKTSIILPLMINGEPIGSISLYASDPGKFRLIETDFLEKFAQHCSLALFTKLQAKG